MSHLNNMSYICRLYDKYELCKLYEYFYKQLKITGYFLKNGFFLLIYKDGNPKL